MRNRKRLLLLLLMLMMLLLPLPSQMKVRRADKAPKISLLLLPTN